MDHLARLRAIPPQAPSAFIPPSTDAPRSHPDPQPEPDRSDPNIAFMKGPKRKRLAKARFHIPVSQQPTHFPKGL